MNLFLNQFIEINCLNEPIYLKNNILMNTFEWWLKLIDKSFFKPIKRIDLFKQISLI